MTVRGFLMGMLVGGIVGAALGMIYAPMEGRETRRKISDAAKSARTRASGYASSVSDKVKSAAGAVRPSI